MAIATACSVLGWLRIVSNNFFSFSVITDLLYDFTNNRSALVYMLVYRLSINIFCKCIIPYVSREICRNMVLLKLYSKILQISMPKSGDLVPKFTSKQDKITIEKDKIAI